MLLEFYRHTNFFHPTDLENIMSYRKSIETKIIKTEHFVTVTEGVTDKFILLTYLSEFPDNAILEEVLDDNAGVITLKFVETTSGEI